MTFFFFLSGFLGLVSILVSLSAIIFLLGFLLLPIVKGAPFVPSEMKTVEKMVEIANIKPGERVVDLGSGEGRMLIAVAKKGVEAHGYEINPLLVWWARRNIKNAGLQGKAFVHWKSFWGIDYASFDVVLLFGIFYIMRRLEKKLRKELKPGARVISNAFTFPSWVSEKSESGVHLYKVSSSKLNAIEIHSIF